MVRDLYNPTNYFNVEQPNPTEKFRKARKSDCAVRALAIATGWEWRTAYDELCRVGREVYDMPNGQATFEQLFDDLGFKKEGYGKIKKGDRRMSAKQFALAHKTGTYILSLANHLTCVKGGKIRDAWNCGDKYVYKWWIVEKG